MSFRVLLNPTAGRGAADAAREVIEPRVGRERVIVTQGADHLRDEARRAVRDRLERVVVAGGDGTAHLVIQELAGSRTALAVLNLGSGNDLAATLQMPAGLRRGVDVALTSPFRPMDLGRIGDRYFALYCGFGLDGEVSRIYNERVRWLRGTAGYVWAAVRAMVGFDPPFLTLDDGTERVERRLMLALAANAPRCGGGMLVAPMAAIDSGRLELVLLDEVSRPRLLLLLGKVFRGAHLGHPKVHHRTVESFEISSDRPLAVYGDGERLLEVGETPVRVTVEPGALMAVRGPGRP